MAEIASLGLRIDGVDGVDRAASALARLENASESLEKAASSLSTGAGRVSKNIGEIDKASAKSTSSVNALANAARSAGALLAGAFSINALKNYADSWSDMQSQVGSSIGDMSSAVNAMQRVVEIANASYSPLTQTVEVFSRNVSTFKDLGKYAQEAADFTEAMNHALVTTATKGQNADVVINSVSRALATGGLNAMDFDTIVSRSPRVLQAMADELGVNTSQLRALAAQGKVTSDVIASGLINSLGALRDEAALMPATIADSFSRVFNNTTALVGSFDKLTGASEAVAGGILKFADGLGGLAKNEDTLKRLAEAGGVLVDIGGVLAVVLGGRLVGAATSSASAFAMLQIQAARAQIAVFTAGGASTTAAARIAAMGAASRAASAGMALLGGPVGVVITGLGLAAYAWSKYGKSARDNADEGVLGLADAKDGIDKLVEGYEKLNRLQQQSLVSVKTEELAQATKDASRAVFDLGNAFKPATGDSSAAKFRAEFTAEIKGIAQDTSLSSQEMAASLSGVIDKYVSSGRSSEDSKAKLIQMAQAIVAAAGDANRLAAELQALAGAQSAVAGAAGPAGDALEKTQRENYKKFMLDYATPDEKLKAAVEEQKQLLGSLYDPEVEKRLRNRFLPKNGGSSGGGASQDAGASYSKAIQERIALIGKETEYEQLLAKIRSGSIKFSSDAQKASALASVQTLDLLTNQAKAAEDALRGNEQNLDFIKKLSIDLGLASLRGEELAQAQALLSLNEYATPEQIAQVEAMTSALYKAREVAAKKDRFGTGEEADKFILGDPSPLSGGAFDNQFARYEAEAEQERERYRERQALLIEARELQIQTSRSYDELELAAAQQHADRMAQIDMAKNSVMLSSASSAFGALAQIMRHSQGEQSGIYRGMFAASKAFAVADATINAYGAISKAWNSAIFPANLAAVAATAPQVMAVVSAVSGTGLSGMAHDGIDSVPTTGTWLLEKGERVTTSKTSAKLDSVLERIDARQRQAASGSEGISQNKAEKPRVTVQLIGSEFQGARVTEERGATDEETIIRVVSRDFMRGGDAFNTLQSVSNVQRVGR